jgi:hypothetical protein
MTNSPAIDAASATLMVNAYVDQLDASAGSMKIFSGNLPANCAAADPSGLLVTITLPAPAFGAGSSGVAAKLGTWSGTAAAAGTALCFRIYLNGGTCIGQGTCGNTSGYDLNFDSTTIASGATVTISTFTATQPLA